MHSTSKKAAPENIVSSKKTSMQPTRRITELGHQKGDWLDWDYLIERPSCTAPHFLWGRMLTNDKG